MLLLSVVLLALSAIPTSLAKDGRHHRSHTLSTTVSTFSTLTTASNATMSLTTMSATSSVAGIAGGSSCPTVTKTVLKTIGGCPDIKCLPVLVGGTTPVATSTFVVGCGCPAATPTETLSQCDSGCEKSTAWLYKTAGGC